MQTRADLTADRIRDLSNTLAWNFTVASDDPEKIRKAIVIGEKYGMLPDPTEIDEIIGSDPRELARQFKHSVRFMNAETRYFPNRLQAWEFAGEAGDAFEGSYMIAGAAGFTGANYFMVLDKDKRVFRP